MTGQFFIGNIRRLFPFSILNRDERGGIHGIPVIFGKVLFHETENGNWCLEYVFFENFDEMGGILESLIKPEDNSTNLINRFADTISSLAFVVSSIRRMA
jgi:hypothetical protein